MFCSDSHDVVARKNHVCTYCAQTINKGEIYKTWTNVDDSWFTNKMHLECADAQAEDARHWGEYEYTAYSNERPTPSTTEKQ